jgi:hypothetical protein
MQQHLTREVVYLVTRSENNTRQLGQPNCQEYLTRKQSSLHVKGGSFMAGGRVDPTSNIPAWGKMTWVSATGKDRSKSLSIELSDGNNTMQSHLRALTFNNASLMSHIGGKTQMRCPSTAQSLIIASHPSPTWQGVAVKNLRALCE